MLRVTKRWDSFFTSEEACYRSRAREEGDGARSISDVRYYVFLEGGYGTGEQLRTVTWAGKFDPDPDHHTMIILFLSLTFLAKTCFLQIPLKKAALVIDIITIGGIDTIIDTL